MRHVIARATLCLYIKSESSKAGSKFITYEISRHYNIMRVDYAAFSRHVADVMLTDMSLTCGLNRVRFYMWHHGMRLEKTQADSYLSHIDDMNHPHVDVVQIHRADNLSFDDDDPTVIKLSGRGDDSLLSMFGDSINLGRKKMDRYRIGFLQDYGYFARNASLPYKDTTS